MELRVAARHVGQHRCDMVGAKRQRCRDTQTATQLTLGRERFLGVVDLGAGACGVVAESNAGFGERGAACRACEELHAELGFESRQEPTHDRLGDTEPEGGGRHSTSVSDLHEGP